MSLTSRSMSWLTMLRQKQIVQKLLRRQTWEQWLTIVTGLSFLYCSNPAQAAEKVRLEYADRQITVSLTELQTYVETGEGPDDLQEFIARIPSEEGFERRLLADKLPLQFDARDNQPISRNAQFVLYQVNKLIGNVSGQEDYEALRHALLRASASDDFTILELLTEYPSETVRVEMRGLEQLYGNVNLFLERLQPLVQSQQFIEDWLCECDTASASTSANSDVLSRCSSPDLTPTASEIQDVVPLIVALDWLKHAANTADSATIAPTALANPVPFAAPTLIAADLTAWSSSPLDSAHNSEMGSADNTRLASASVTIAPNSVAQNKQVVLTFGPLGRSLTLEELTHFAETGEASQKLLSLLGLANIDPEIFQVGLNRQVKVNGRLVDRVLRNLLGEYFLFRVGDILHSKSGRADILALRSTLVLSTLDDNLISPIEFLQRYPLQSLYVDGVALLRFEALTRHVLNQDFGQTTGQIGDWLEGVQQSIAAEICDCEAIQAQQSPIETPDQEK